MKQAILIINIPDNAKAEDYAIDRIWKYIPEEDDEMPFPIKKTFKRFRPMPEKIDLEKVIYNSKAFDRALARNNLIDELLGENND